MKSFFIFGIDQKVQRRVLSIETLQGKIFCNTRAQECLNLLIIQNALE